MPGISHPPNTDSNRDINSGNNILMTIQNILSEKNTILQDHDFEDTAFDLPLFESLVKDFEKYDRRKSESEDKRIFYADLRNTEDNRLISMLLDMMKIKIEIFDKELTIAHEIQQKLLPDKTPEIDGFEVRGYYHPSRKVGGDYYDFYLNDDDKMHFLIADVSGHGIPSSLIVSSMQAFIYAQIMEKKVIVELMTNLNKFLTHTLISGKFVTMFLGLLNLKTGEIEYINAGHNPPKIVTSDKSVSELCGGGPLLGVFNDAGYTSKKAQLNEGDILALYTDGAVESMNEQEEEFSIERFTEAIKSHCNEHPLKITANLVKELRTFCGGEPYQDDITLLFIKRCEECRANT